jgi:hypothetical protein
VTCWEAEVYIHAASSQLSSIEYQKTVPKTRIESFYNLFVVG